VSHVLLKKAVAKAIQTPLPTLYCCICERPILKTQRQAAKLTWWIDTNYEVNAAGLVHNACCPVRSVVDDDGLIWFKHEVHATDVTPQIVWELIKTYGNLHWRGSSYSDFRHNAFLLATWFGQENF
jgi:hypothetical protein